MCAAITSAYGHVKHVLCYVGEESLLRHCRPHGWLAFAHLPTPSPDLTALATAAPTVSSACPASATPASTTPVVAHPAPAGGDDRATAMPLTAAAANNTVKPKTARKESPAEQPSPFAKKAAAPTKRTASVLSNDKV
ncbi:hypothetical protein GN958_ATG15397, partial [Phytophthora infestans]